MTNLSTDSNFNFNKLFNLFGVFNFALLLALSASLLFASPKSSEAATTSAQAGSSVYYASISNEDSVTIPVTPTATQIEYTNKASDSKITFSSTCPKGSYVYINTNSKTDNALTRTGSDSGKKTIEAVAGDSTSGLTDNTWGYKTSGKAFTQVPVSTSPAVLYASSGIETNTSIEVVYGVKVDNTLPSGTYSNDVVYTVVVDNRCLQYTLKFDTQGGSTISDASVNYGDTVNLNNYTTTKSGYIFGGWSNGSSDFTGKETTAQPNSTNDFTVTLTACWVKNSAYEYDFVSPNGGEQTFTAPCNGYYKLEVWGAQGGDAQNEVGDDNNHPVGGYGGYSIGVYKASTSNTLYINVGGKGQDNIQPESVITPILRPVGGYNGGGYGHANSSATTGNILRATGGGGATHIAKISGELKTLESYKGTLVNNSYYDSSEILIVAGGGSGAYTSGGNVESTSKQWCGGTGGGFRGGFVDNLCMLFKAYRPTEMSSDLIVATQTTGYKFGEASSTLMEYEDEPYGARSNSNHSGGGGGWYGGRGGYGERGNGGGSGYIGSSNLISGGGITKHMTGYNVSTSTVDATRTNSNKTTPTSTPTADVARIGNGYARITYLGTSI